MKINRIDFRPRPDRDCPCRQWPVSLGGFLASYGGDQNTLTAGNDGKSVVAANFVYGGNPGTVTFEGLTPGRSYRATFLSVGWDDAPITRNLSFTSDTNSLLASPSFWSLTLEKQ